MSARSEVAALLRPLLPASWRIVTTEEAVDKISTTLVRLSQTALQRHPAAPYGSRLVEFDCVIVAPGINLAIAEDRLDQDVDALLWAVESTGGKLHWSRAEKSQIGPNIGYIVTLTATTIKPPKE